MIRYEIGWWDEDFGLAASGIRSITKQARRYLAHGHGATDKPIIMFAQSGQATIGVYIGQGLESQVIGSSAHKIFEDNLANLNVTTPALAMQFCGPDLGGTHSFGLMVTSNATFGSLQSAVQSWANGTCLSFSQSTNMTGQVLYATPLDELADVKNSTKLSSKLAIPNNRHSRRHQHLHVRAECKTIQVNSGDSCAKLATRCGISASDFTKYNPGSKFCAELMPKQHVCCSKGDLPDLRPPKNSDGSCHAYKVQENENCASIAIENGLKMEDLKNFNKKAWGWAGCKRLFYKTVMCLSEGDPPFPDPISNARCGPQKPGTEKSKDATDISDLNSCPLNACYNIWGQCGITKDFCTDTNTGAPGTAKENTNGCISNCGTKIVKGSGDDSDFNVEVGDKLSQYQFQEFKRVEGVKKILSFGGWDFSTKPAPYAIFREGVKPANRLTMATKIANFIIENDLEGVDIDWEYPGAPDIPGIPPAEKDEGKNYLAFLAVLRNLLKGRSLSIAAPSSYWYMKQFPIKDIAKVLDYIVYMTYDLHGQWDTEKAFSQEGCEFGNCLRSQVNLTETQYSLAMITKAGVPSNKVIVGVTSFGRSFKMVEAGCYGPECLYTGDRLNSDAKKGKCTDTASYIADAEIGDILKDTSRVVKHFVDSTSNSDILIYDDTEWVSYMSSSTKKVRENLYKSWGMGGTTDWAVDLQTYHDVPKPAKSWAIFKENVSLGKNPKEDYTRTGNWTDYFCTDPLVRNTKEYSISERWRGLQADDAWKDVTRIYKDTDKGNKVIFSNSIAQTFNVGNGVDCRVIIGGGCNTKATCKNGMDAEDSGPAAEMIWDSFVYLHEMFAAFDFALYKAATGISFSLDDFGNKFAPIPEEEDNTWLLVLIDLVTIGTATAAGPFFNSFLKKLPYFAANAATHDNIKDTTMTLIGQSTTLAKDLLPSKDSDWTPEKQASFNSYMGQIIKYWSGANVNALRWIFDGTDEAIDTLWNLISDGKLVGGPLYDGESTLKQEDDLQANIEKSFYGLNIPTLWRLSETYAFVLDSGYNCNEEYPVKDYLDEDTMDATSVCYEGRRYYLVYPKGDSEECSCSYIHTHCERTCKNNKFSAPPGLDSLDGTLFGGITKEDLIKGSVRTYNKNGKKNVAGDWDPTGDDSTFRDLLDVDITTPGLVRLPVCSPERAFQSWDTASKGSSPSYPCDIPPGKNECGDSTFVNETSDKSPLVKDCESIIKNIEGDGGTKWTTQVVGKNQRKIAAAGTCAFGVEATKVDGNVNFAFGGQDLIDIINTSVEKYSKDGKIGATGDLHCSGNVKQQPVHWAIYHT
ncbi:hypothetical protein NW767_009046 [Fusarium falciforme]|nr:hypothetical protein NW767_009046 [Fusarium falciforme]